jgi:hypothetical protein
MKLKENISIDEFDGKRYQIRIVEPNNGKAVLTHYLHNIQNGVSKYYKDDALKVLEIIRAFRYNFFCNEKSPKWIFTSTPNSKVVKQ